MTLRAIRASRIAQRGHHRRGLEAPTGYVTDDHQDVAVIEPNDVVPVPADVNAFDAGDIPRAELEPPDLREGLREKAVLQGLRDGALLRVQLRVLGRERLRVL